MRLFNDFCEGRHPLFPDFCADGRNGTIDLRIDAGGPQSGMFLRRSDRLDDAHFRSIHASSHPPRAEDAQACQEWIAEAGLAASTVPSPSVPPSSGAAATAAATASLSDELTAANSDISEAGGSSGGGTSSSCRTIGAVFNAWIARFRVACVRDYYPMWRASDGLPTTGKLVFIHPLSTADRDLHIFFDDYIAIDEHDPKCIVDARCALTSAPLPLAQTLGKHLLRVRTMDAILEQDYFIKAFQEAAGC